MLRHCKGSRQLVSPAQREWNQPRKPARHVFPDQLLALSMHSACSCATVVQICARLGICTDYMDPERSEPPQPCSNVPCQGTTLSLFSYRRPEASAPAAGAVGLGPPRRETTNAHPGAAGDCGADRRHKEAAVNPAAVLSAGATSPVRAADDKPAPVASWLPLANPKTQRMESIGNGARAVSHAAETASQPASPKLAVLASDDIPWNGLKGSSSPGSINNDSIGLGLVPEEEGPETRPSRSRLVLTSEPGARAGIQLAHDGAHGMGYSVRQPTEGDDLGTPSSEAPSTVQTSAAEALQGLRATGRQVKDQHNLETGLPSQHGMATRHRLKTDQAAEMLVQIRETGVREARNADEADLDSSEDSAGQASALCGRHSWNYIICQLV